MREARSDGCYTTEDVSRFSGEDGRARLVSGHRLQLGEIPLLLHLPVSETKEEQEAGTVLQVSSRRESRLSCCIVSLAV